MPSTHIGRNLFYFAIFAVFSLSGLLWMAINTGQRIGPLPPQFLVSFDVRDADGLVEGSEVRIAGVQVGKVNTVTTTDRGARVQMGIDPAYNKIYTDATVLIRPKSLLGEKYVDMNRGQSNVLVPEGGSLPESQAFTQVEVDQVLNNSDEATRKALSVNIISLGEATKDRGADVNATIPELRKIAEHLTPVSARFKDRTAQIDHILVDTDIILTTLADEHQQLATLLQSADSVTGTIARNDAHLANIINHGGNVIVEINTAVGQQNNDANIHTAIAQAPPVLGHLNEFLDLTNENINTLVPSLLLGQQYTYPNDQLTVAQPSAIQISKEWDSATRMYDSGVNGYHGFTAIGLMCAMSSGDDCPGTNPGYGPRPGTAQSAGGTPLITPLKPTGPKVTVVDPSVTSALLDYLLGK
ncbi:MAG: phospholipid/cholesterol/gamma-HCH transport system substrate-binding protein [Chloroflexota bacterium]|nr:phospholipid/cholesterol/gamma-HCH transport system substrate-binding protein [Chloroflexota bacterium]